MQRFHVHLNVADLDKSVAYYSLLFGRDPDLLKEDYAQWLSDEPGLNFALSNRCGEKGVSHLGLQFENPEAFDAYQKEKRHLDKQAIEEQGAQCCYAISNKLWLTDPDGIRWEAFSTSERIEQYGEG